MHEVTMRNPTSRKVDSFTREHKYCEIHWLTKQISSKLNECIVFSFIIFDRYDSVQFNVFDLTIHFSKENLNFVSVKKKTLSPPLRVVVVDAYE